MRDDSVVWTALLLVSMAAATIAVLAWRKTMECQRELDAARRIAGHAARYVALVRRALETVLVYARDEEELRRIAAKRRKRYVAFRIVYEGEPPAPQALEKAIIETAKSLAGTIGVSEAGMSLAYYNPERAAGVLRVNHTHKNLAIAALALTRSIDGRRVLIIPLRTSGTIRRAKKTIQEEL